MLEINGGLTVFFKVKNASDLAKVMVYCKEYDCMVIQKQTKPVKAESQDKIIKLLKDTFQESFTMSDAVDIVLSKIGLKRSSTRYAVAEAKKVGTILKRGNLYVWSDFIQNKVAASLQAGPAEGQTV